VHIARTLFAFWNIMRSFQYQLLPISANSYVHVHTKFAVYARLPFRTSHFLFTQIMTFESTDMKVIHFRRKNPRKVFTVTNLGFSSSLSFAYYANGENLN